MRLSHEEEIRQLTEELSEAEAKYEEKVAELEEKHEREVKDYQDTIQKLRDGNMLLQLLPFFFICCFGII